MLSLSLSLRAPRACIVGSEGEGTGVSERRVCGGGECEQWLSMAASVRERVRVCVSLFLSLSLSLSRMRMRVRERVCGGGQRRRRPTAQLWLEV